MLAFSSSDLQELSNIAAPRLEGDTIGSIVSDVFKSYFLPAVGIVLFVYLLLGGYEIMTSAGNPKGLASGKGKITNALVGFVIIFIAYWLVQIISVAFGLQSFADIF